MYNEVIFDIETQRWFDEVGENNHKALGVSIVSLYKRNLDDNLNEVEGKVMSFWEKEIDKLWPILQGADRIIGFNSLGFDIPVLEAYTDLPLKKLPHLDILQIIKSGLGKRISLDAIAKETLGRAKIEEGIMATTLWERGDKKSLERLQAYCEEDVAITKDIYDFGSKNKFLKYKDKWNTPRIVNVDFSYTKEQSEIKQFGLF